MKKVKINTKHPPILSTIKILIKHKQITKQKRKSKTPIRIQQEQDHELRTQPSFELSINPKKKIYTHTQQRKQENHKIKHTEKPYKTKNHQTKTPKTPTTHPSHPKTIENKKTTYKTNQIPKTQIPNTTQKETHTQTHKKNNTPHTQQ